MTVSSIKNRWLSNWKQSLKLVSWVAFVAFGLPQRGVSHEGSTSYQYRYEFQSRLAYHLREPNDLASQRQWVILEQKLQSAPWTLSAGLRAYAEGAFGSNSTRYRDSQALQLESTDLSVRDLYLEYRRGPWLLRLGNQQVVWGEAFGFYFADIVNPKDLRELGLLDLEMQRIPTPLVNVKWISSDYSLQFLYIPKPFFNQMAVPGSDFAFPFSHYFSGAQFEVNEERSLPLTLANGEVGARATGQLGNFDLSLFSLSYFDRFSSYRPRLTSLNPVTLALDATHLRIFSLGATGTADYSPFLFRTEIVYTRSRSFDALSEGIYSNFLSDEGIAVLGIDTTLLDPWHLALQLSLQHRFSDVRGAILDRDRPLISLHLNGSPWRDHTLDMILTYNPQDGSSLAELRYQIPLNANVELILATDLLSGGNRSQFGQFTKASRGYVLLKAYLGG